ncbi:hypothetical protein D3C87_164130 [compost metagenome]
MTTLEYLDRVMVKCELLSDSALASKLEVSKSAVSLYRTGQRVMDEEVCLKIAHLLKLSDPYPVLLAAGLERAKRSGKKSNWRYFSSKKNVGA